MQVLRGKHGGFCFGVKRAVETAEKLSGENNYILGEIIHNEEVIEKLEKKGLKTIEKDDFSCLKKGDTLLIRTHGEPKETFDMANELGLNVIDCTCPFVKDIQNIVGEKYAEGYKIVIIGNENHPEVKGINGWCNNSALITSDGSGVENIEDEKICVVVQTTFSEEKFQTIIQNFNFQGSKTLDIFKTICYTTTKRQKEADIISKKCDAVLVVGGANSNNTEKLFEICAKNCINTFRIVNPKDFDYRKIKNFIKFGIVFGASTPSEHFREVISNMEKVTEEIITTETLEAVAEEVKEEVVEVKAEKSEMEKAFEGIKPSKNLHINQIVRATISSVNDDGLTISLKNIKSDFELPKEELLEAFDKDAYKAKIGEEIRVMVVAKNPLKFSEKAMAKIIAEEAAVEEIKNGKIFEIEITDTNKGGLIGKYAGYDVFVPSSQIRIGFVKDLEKYKGKTLRLQAEKVESGRNRRQIVASQRVILEKEKAERDAIKAEKEAEFFGNIQEGDVVIGTPVRFAAFGAFVDVNGFDCLAHISDLSWTGCKDCAEILEIGKTYEFKILKIDEENKRVSIGYKQLQPKPWDTILEKYSVGDIIKGKVVRIVSFGAFVEVEKGIDGLVHVSQISNKWLENPVTALQVGEEVEAKIIDINPEKEKMTLSIKALLPEEEKPAEEVKKEKKEDVEEADLREWKDDANEGVSIADLIGNSEN